MSAPDSTIDYYNILEVAPTASPEVIEAAYRGLMQKYGESPDPAVREKRRYVEDAHRVLSNVEKRKAYDEARNGFVVPKSEPAPTKFGGATIVACARDPEVQTALRCSRCDTPICPKCLIQTPVGARCRDCARLAKSPVYTMTGSAAAKAAAASVVGGVVMGLIWGFVLMPFTFGFLSIFVGAALGWVFTRMLEIVTRRKRGPYVVGFAVLGIGIAYGIQFLFVPWRVALYGLVAAAVAVYFAYQSLR